MHSIAAVVILYNPDKNVFDNICTYSNQVDKIFVIDNSKNSINIFVRKVQSLNNAEYIWNKTNMGIAHALNVGVKKASVEGYEYLLTMDQDSNAPPLMVSNLFDCFTQDSNIAIVSSLLLNPKGRNLNYDNKKVCEQIFTAWTSGNLVNIKILEQAEGYNENLFIDYVDHEICLRLNKLGYKIYRCNKVFINHNLGKVEEKNLLFRKVYPTNHSALRLYYRTRNRFYVKKKYKDLYPEFFKQDDKDFWKTFLKVILFEKDKYKKIKFSLLGYLDYRKNKFGKFKIK